MTITFMLVMYYHGALTTLPFTSQTRCKLAARELRLEFVGAQIACTQVHGEVVKGE